MIRIRDLGLTEYVDTLNAMREFTLAREPDTPDEIWLTEHFPVFTQGQAGKPEHLLVTQQSIPVVQSDRGGQITYHGPGQSVIYLLIDIKRASIGIRQLVSLIENSTIEYLAEFDITGYAKSDAPGVYIDHQETPQKIASLGLRVKNGRTYHGLALNVDMDLSPFQQINPCGYHGMQVTQLRHYTTFSHHQLDTSAVSNALATRLMHALQDTGNSAS
ncbi:lipoyl(octanoyl) transferase LipB [Ostreibacterium oceani]|uniref:Octanoyltransferase n=1 Tax=Ostreibacterium oceani TaxID=2654998 RepID=A0A6N7EW94_9GAMM|nr:lipoyl(octanoyl) transferase LipB [Ostreibacterium oceani]MPV85820.1 lipoyl(octanoyl) transferase LipB [Ostreibacterium oceani]